MKLNLHPKIYSISENAGILACHLARFDTAFAIIAGSGSRSSPLAAAAAMQPTARLVPCIDERSLAFFALGYGRAKRQASLNFGMAKKHCCGR